MPRLSVYKSKSLDGRDLSSEWEEISENLIEVPSFNESEQETSIKIEMMVLVDDDCDLEQVPENLSDLNNSFYYSCNEDWITVIRNRNLVTLVIRNNYSTEERNGIISFFHNVGKYDYKTMVEDGEEVSVAVENEININILQHGYEYSVQINGVFNGEGKNVILESLPEGYEEKSFSVTCIGGRERFKVRKVKKYRRLVIKENETADAVELINPVAYDNAFQIEYTENGFKIKNYGNVNCNYTEKCAPVTYPLEIKTCHTGNPKKRSLIVDDYYYEITVHHIDCIDCVDTIIVTYDSNEEEKIQTTPKAKTKLTSGKPFIETFPIIVDLDIMDLTERLFDAYENGDFETYNQILAELNALMPHNEDENHEENVVNGGIACSVNELIFESNGGTKTATVTTEPEDAAVFIKNRADFITKCAIEGNEIRVTLKRNPYPFERSCVITLINAIYPENSINVSLIQLGAR